MKKTVLTLALAAMLCISAPLQTFAAPTEKTTDTQSTQNTDISNVDTNGNVFMENDSMTPPSVDNSDAALLMDMNSGRLLYGKNINKRVFPASTTKIMTGILAIEMGNFEEVVSASVEAIEPITLEDSHMGILIGEELTFEQLVKGMLIHSANDAANVLAVHLGGSMDAFTDIMNQKAQELGMKDTHFENACGTHHDNHYTTAQDLAILSQYAMQNETFRDIVKTAIYKIPPTNKYTKERILVNTNLFLSSARSAAHYNPLCTGIKTGHTSQSGYCLVSSAQYEDIYLLSIVMGCPNEDLEEKAYSYIDSKALFDFGFNNYMGKVIAAPGDIVSDSKVYEAKSNTRVALTVETPVNALVPSSSGDFEEIEIKINLPEQIAAPVTKGSVLGTVTYSYKGTQIGTSNLIATNDVERNEILHIINIIVKIILSPFFFVPALIIIILLIISDHKKKKRIRQRRLQQLRNQGNKKTPDRNASRNEQIEIQTKGSNSRYR